MQFDALTQEWKGRIERKTISVIQLPVSQNRLPCVLADTGSSAKLLGIVLGIHRNTVAETAP